MSETETCHCGKKIRACLEPVTDGRQNKAGFYVTAQECCVSGWRHVESGFHDCQDPWHAFAYPARLS